MYAHIFCKNESIYEMKNICKEFKYTDGQNLNVYNRLERVYRWAPSYHIIPYFFSWKTHHNKYLMQLTMTVNRSLIFILERKIHV